MRMKSFPACFGLMFLLSVAWSTALTADERSALQRVKEAGALTVAVYKDFPPFSFRNDRGRVVGIDADIARALAERLGVSALIRSVGADESMEDDLRNNVWKGHYLGGGVADVMLHVPYDKAFAEDNDRVIILAPYYREQIIVATKPGDAEDPLGAFARGKVGVELDTLADFFLLSTRNGALRDHVVHYRSVGEAVKALKLGELAGVSGPRTEVEFALGEQLAQYRISTVPGLSRDGWTLGAAVKQGNDSLAEEIAAGVQALRNDGVIAEIFSRYNATYEPPLTTGQVLSERNAMVAFDDNSQVCKRRP